MMSRIILLLLLVFTSLNGYSQLDTIHYLPPLFGRTNVDQHYISISTLSTNVVSVEIKKGDGTLIQNVTVTDISPSLISLGSGVTAQGIIDESGLNAINTSDGIIVTSTEPIFVNLRHVQSAQGLCLTSKGRFALGTEFRSGHLYTSLAMSSTKAHEIAVMATEDNTTVSFTDISNNVEFKNTIISGGTSVPITVTLDEGESYVIAAYVDEPGATGNINDVNGTKISSNKPIAVNSGSWLSGANGSGRDIGVDQITPLDVIGTEYVFTEGNGGVDNERPCVVAEFNNTQIFINGGATPVATINSGDYYFILNSAFAANGNIYVRTTQPSYIYQSLSGTSAASNGLNFIPPIRCSGNSSVIIPNVNLVGTASVSITARSGADVFVNGSTIPLVGALAVIGNPFWVTYSVNGGTGNFTVYSDSVINVALLTLNGVRGSAGYFSGFGSLQEIERGDTSDFVICHDNKSSFIKLNIDGPYSSITPFYLDPSLGGAITVNSVATDSIYFTYSNLTPSALIDTVELEVCKVLICSGTVTDTFCTVSTLIFEKLAPINAGIGDSIAICQDTNSIDLYSILTGSPPNTGTWVDGDNSGYLFNGIFQTNLSLPGVYHYSYLVDGPSFCYDSSIVTINVLPLFSTYCCPISPSFNTQNVNCNGASTGQIEILDPNVLQFSIDGGLSFQSSGTFSSLAAGIYNIRLESGPDCNFDTIITIIEPNILSATFQVDSVLCLNDCNGSIAVSPTGGNQPFTYLINGVSSLNNPLFSALCDGNYSIEIIDSNNCSFTQNVAVFEPNELIIIEDSIVAETCGATNGSIYLSAQGGTPNYLYALNSGIFQNSPIFTGLAAGTYLVEVKDANDCIDQLNITLINESGPIPVIDTLNHISCFSGANGKVVIGVNNGVAPFQYSLNSGPNQASNIFNTILAGNHIITVTDNNGCSAQINFVLTEPSQLALNISSLDATCHNECNGQVFLDVSGSNSSYNFSVNGGVYNAISFNQFDTINNLCADNNINIIVTDSLNCLINAFVNINEPDSIQITPIVVDPTCFYSCDGDISLSAIGGTGAFEYSIDNGLTYQVNNQFSSLCEDFYNLKVRDANQCENSDTVSVIAPPEFKIDTLSISHTTCGNSGGIIQVEIDSPINPNYTFTNLSSGLSVIDPSSATFTNLSAGVYGITALDNSGCSDTMYIGVNDNSLSINLTPISITHVDCYSFCTGSFTVAANGGNFPYQFSINGGIVGNSPTFSGLCAEEYLVLVQDATGCIETIQLEITEPEEISFNTNQVDVNCFGDCTGEIEFLNNYGGTLPYNFSIDNGINYFTDSNFVNVCAGSYDLILNDGNNCIATTIVQINEEMAMSAIHTKYDLTCNNSNDGLIQLTVSGGIPAYSYSYDDGLTFGTNTVQTSLSAGQYNIEVLDDSGCVYYDTIIINEPVANSVTNNKTENLCSYSCDGIFDLNAQGGTAPYLYSIDNGNTFQSSNIFNNLCSDTFQIKVVDLNGCEVNIIDSLIEIDTLQFTAIITNSNCNLPSGTIDISSSGGAPTYTYSLDGVNFVATPLLNNLAAGNYDVYVQDANNCLVQDVFSLSNFTSPQIDSVERTLPCHGVCDGTITVYASLGNGNYEYSLDGINFQNNNQFTAVCGGSYALIVRDGNGCSYIMNYTLFEPDTISFVSNVNSLLCHGDQNGSINLITQGGSGQLSYSFNGGLPSTLASYSLLDTGNYSIIITDDLGCMVQFDTILTQPNEVQFTINSVSPSCFGVCDGSIEVIPSGGTINGGNYQYSWSSSNINNQQINNSCEGLYSIIVQDSNGCIADSINYHLTGPIFATFDSVNVTGVDCFGAVIGSNISVFVPAGNLLSFDNGNTFGVNNQLNDIATGLYWVYTQDANSCDGDSIEIYVPTPQILTGFVGPDMIICPGDLVNFGIYPVGGTLPYQYDWNNGYNFQEVFSENVNINTLYFAEITDANGCVTLTDTQSVTLTLPPVITVSNDTIVCEGESVYLFGLPDFAVEDYVFNWSIGGNHEHFITPEIISDTTFFISITDECNLTTTDSIFVNTFVEPIIQFTIDSVFGCLPFSNDFIVQINPQNSIGGNIIWSNELGTITSANNNTISISYNSPGQDFLYASFTSINGCAFDVDVDAYINISETPIADFSYLPELPNNYDDLIEFTNESEDYITSEWNIDNKVFILTNVDFPISSVNNIYNPITVCLEVENDNFCVDDICKQISIKVDQLVYVPNAFTPGSGDNNTVFKAVGTNIDIYGFHLIIFNRWGEIVFESYDINEGWDGTFGGKDVSSGVYTWKIEAEIKSEPGTVNNLMGHVTLLR